MFRAYGTNPTNKSTVNTELVQPWALTNYSPTQKKKGNYLIDKYGVYMWLFCSDSCWDDRPECLLSYAVTNDMMILLIAIRNFS